MKRGSFKCLGSSIISDRFNNEEDTRGASSITFTSNSYEECENFISWIDTKLIRFLVAMNISKLGPVFTEDYFRFVPNCKDFSIKYTDQFMYYRYNIPKQYIDVIESVIMSR